MSFEVLDLPEKQLVTVEFTGVVTPDQLERSMRVVKFFLKAYDWQQVLFDMRHAVPVLTQAEMESFFRTQARSMMPDWRLAVLNGDSQEEELSGIETVAHRHGINLSRFQHEAEALGWLGARPGSVAEQAMSTGNALPEWGGLAFSVMN